MEVAGAFREMRVRREEEKNELHETIEYMNEMPGGLMFTMERNQKMLGDVPELRDTLSGNPSLDGKISANEVELQGKKEELRMLLK